MISKVNFDSSSLFLMIVCLTSGTNSSIIWISTTRGMWLEGYSESGRMEWLSSSTKLGCRNIKLITEFEFLLLSEYLVGTWLVGCEKYNSKESAMSKRISLWTEWKEYSGS